MYWKRDIESGLRSLEEVGRDRLIVLTGARQVGKSTLAKRFFKNYACFDMDSPVERDVYASMTPADWRSEGDRIVIDEIQKLPELFDTVKACHDRFPEMKMVLLGSSQVALMRGVRETLAGRAAVRELYPFSLPELIRGSGTAPLGVLPEFLSADFPAEVLKKIASPRLRFSPLFGVAVKCFASYLRWGGMPKIQVASWGDEDKFDWLTDYQNTYLQRDVADLASLNDLEPFVKAQKLMALNTARLINFSDVARKSSVSSPTAKRFLRYLEMSYQVITLPSWWKNEYKRLVKTPKIHFLDPGVRRAILARRGEVDGHEFESAVVGEIYKQTKNHRLPLAFYHLRTRDGREVDLLIEREDGYIAIECKFSDNVSMTDARHLKELSEILDKPLLVSVVVSNDRNVRVLDEDRKIWNVPASVILS